MREGVMGNVSGFLFENPMDIDMYPRNPRQSMEN
jgi:hypothetical protein